MPNVLRIKGEMIRSTDGCLTARLVANYRNVEYKCLKVTGAPPATVWHFTRCDRKEKGGLNTILLMTAGKGVYRATGLSEFQMGKFQWYRMGDDLEIKVARSADQAIRDSIAMLAKNPQPYWLN